MAMSFRAVRGPSRRSRAAVEWVLSLEPRFTQLSDDDLRKRSLALRYTARSGVPLQQLLPEGFALVREAAWRHLEMRHFPVQLLGGMAMESGAIAEMETGEGKTLTATLPLFLHSLTGKGAHLATANDYLASRDAETMRPLYEALGLTVGVIQAQQPTVERRAAYRCDITYGTAKEFGFDFLRDRLLQRRVADGELERPGGWDGDGSANHAFAPTQRPPHFLVIDEADSILIDEARTPLILSTQSMEDIHAERAAFGWASALAPQLQDEKHFTRPENSRAVRLTATGRRVVRSAAKPAGMERISQLRMYEFAERAVRVNLDYHRDRHFVIRDDEVVIVDESTGRLAEGRKWRDGVHQAVEAKEGLEVSPSTSHSAQISIQDLALEYESICGMTGTAADSARELFRVYRTPVVRIPTNKKNRRKRLKPTITRTADEKWKAVVKEVVETQRAGRPVLIGTRSIDKSEELSKRLTSAGVKHRVLHAKHLAAEADIVAEAGEANRVTVATNMAGRGTDIKLGEGVTKAGGLHVIGTELHDSARIDRQLAGRCARQGDPGSYRLFLALDDDVIEDGFGPEEATQLLRQRSLGSGLRRLFQKAQQKIEQRHFHDRQLLLHRLRKRTKLMKRLGMDPYLDTPS